MHNGRSRAGESPFDQRAAAKRPLRQKTFAFAVRIVRLAQHVRAENKEHVLSKQVLRSGTAIGALVREAEQAESKADFIHKLSIGLKEAGETEYWLQLLHETEYLTAREFQSLNADLAELLKLLTAIIKTTKARQGQE
jgi:four helix bundle protein